ncbi:hypothetical protein SY85_19015 [Flavisolibacter tropicus]|uniref:Uncharacterized protein n=2 Tax=Flavisolibacter tropicus TaxID=1492898 RepID=A0A172U2P7_9BACT|nr:hypothetical protein SY85_19015 [Flavisolibacter tropicus]
MHTTLRLLPIAIFTLLGSYAFAQKSTDKGCKPPINRARWHDLIDKEQRLLLQADGKADNVFDAPGDDDVNYLVTQAATRRVDELQCKIEQDSTVSHQKKVAYLSGIEKSLRSFTTLYRARRVPISQLPNLVNSYEAAMEKDKVGASIEGIIAGNTYEVANMIMSCGAFNGNPHFTAARNILVMKYSITYPSRTFQILRDNPDVPFRDSLIRIAAYKHPNLLYDYAAANNKLGYAIRKIDDPLIKTVSRIATSGGSGQMYFPFIDNIMSGKQTLEQIDSVKNDEVKYYKLLVKTRIDYMDRLLNKDTLYGMAALDYQLRKKASEYFIKTINALHEESDPVRFRILNQLTAQELYYLAVFSESEIYTSSYTRGVYPYMMQKIANRGDSLLLSVSFDKFRKFIRLAAGFNTLSEFLNSFPDKGQAERLMTAFVNGLEKTNSLEDGVDIADSYASISENNKPLANRMLENVKNNYERNLAENNQRGIIMYNLLYKLFESADSSFHIDLSKEFGIPPVYSVSYDALTRDSAHQVVIQVFFYGDQDGKNIFQGYLRQFGSGWKRADTKQWVSFTSTKGKPIVIYANKPLPEETDEDEEAQKALTAYLQQNDMEPSIIIHRGHSYYADYTIDKIQPSAKIVFLGSCGGYHLIHKVLQHAPDAHIIASKQIGKTVINQPFINLLMDKLQKGSNIDWIPFWKEFSRQVTDKEGLEDYIPPHKNLGALFIKAYKLQTGEDDDDDVATQSYF